MQKKGGRKKVKLKQAIKEAEKLQLETASPNPIIYTPQKLFKND